MKLVHVCRECGKRINAEGFCETHPKAIVDSIRDERKAKPTAKGIFGWSGGERRSNRYGSFVLAVAPYNGVASADVNYNLEALRGFVGSRVRIVCVVTKSRKSGHIGDWSIGVFPTRPKKGERIELGVGVLATNAGYDGSLGIELEPEDGRGELWMDPRKLYRLHDQTVDVFIEATEDPCSPAPDLSCSNEETAISNGDGSFQVKTKAKHQVFVKPAIEKIGDGLFALTPPGCGEAGTRFDVEKRPETYDQARARLVREANAAGFETQTHIRSSPWTPLRDGPRITFRGKSGGERIVQLTTYLSFDYRDKSLEELRTWVVKP